jgi:formate transporter FocA
MANSEFSIDALLPPDMAVRAEEIGIRKAAIGFYTMFALAVLAGAFIALGAVFATTVSSPTITVDAATSSPIISSLPYGAARLLSGLVFCLGLILVVVAGAELFTGNNLIVMAWASGRVSTAKLLRNWVIVYIGNFVGSVGTAGLMFFSRQYMFGRGAIGLNALNIANSKAGLGFVQAIFLGILCNTLVCLAVWLVFSARSTTDKILSIIFPISAFVAAGFEHSVANMYFIPIGLLIKWFAPEAFWTNIGKTAADFGNLTIGGFLINNLLPVTIGNIIGGAVLVGAVYWFIYLRHKRSPASPSMPPRTGSD